MRKCGSAAIEGSDILRQRKSERESQSPKFLMSKLPSGFLLEPIWILDDSFAARGFVGRFEKRPSEPLGKDKAAFLWKKVLGNKTNLL